MEKPIKELGEERLIQNLSKMFSQPHPRLLKAIGDDTSVTLQASGMALLSTTDSLISGTHFKKNLTPARLLGKKALSISLSDIAAMGGAPLFFLVSIAVPPDTPRSFIDELYKGISARSRESGAYLAGGNTARSRQVMVSTTVFGEAPEKEVVYRSGACEGDLIYVTGTPGDSALGLKILLKEGLGAMKGPYKRAVAKHLDPAARLELGRALSKNRLSTAMIDVSDGVALDLKRLCEESRMGALLEAEKMPLSDELTRFFRDTKKALETALTGGEDYELLFTAKEKDSAKIAALSKKFKLRITCIGRVAKGRGVKIKSPGNMEIRLKKLGFEHF